MVGLTFDDGPHPVLTPQVLDILNSHDAKSYIFSDWGTGAALSGIGGAD